MSQITDLANHVDVRHVPVALIVNTKARKGQDFYGHAQQALHSAGIKLTESYPLTKAKLLPQLVQSLVKRGVKAIILGSGDGTISSVVDHLVNNDVALG